MLDKKQSLDKIWVSFCKELIGEYKQNLAKVISYKENEKYIEYTEGYKFREKIFSKRIKRILSQPDFKAIFMLVHGAYYSSNNIEQFKYFLAKFLAKFVSKKYNKDYRVFFTLLKLKLDDTLILTNFISKTNFTKEFKMNLNNNQKYLINFSIIEQLYDIYKEVLNINGIDYNETTSNQVT